jgi:L-iditol 2-dehydrogenase
MKAVKLYAARDLRLDDVPAPAQPTAGDVLIRVDAVGICGSDLHMYQDGRIGDTDFSSPLVLGHEFMGTVIALGENAHDGNHQPLQVGQRVAVEPSTPCYHCEMCELGHPNLCPNHTFYGVYPTDGALQEQMIVHARNCFPMPDSISDGAGTLLETLGVAIHAVDLAKIKVANTVSVIGCGPVGLLILQLVKRMGAREVYAFDKLDWRVEKAREYGAVAWNVDQVNALDELRKATGGRGTDLVFEVAWADESVQTAIEMVRIGGRVMLVGIPGDDRLTMTHSIARRKGLSLIMARRMKHTYPRAIALVENAQVDLDGLISEHFTLSQTAEAFAKNAAYAEGVHKLIVDVNRL